MTESRSNWPIGTGWVGFAGVLLLLLGTFNLIDGLTAVLNDDYFIDDLLFAEMGVWGGVAIAVGAIQLLTGVGVFHGRLRRRATVLVSLNAVLQLAWFQHFPLWSGTILLLDALALYALTVHADEFE